MCLGNWEHGEMRGESENATSPQHLIHEDNIFQIGFMIDFGKRRQIFE
jgi:hypothetical protein